MAIHFPDQVHIDRIREALWSRSPFGNAAVLVGSGMSRNARSAVAGGEAFPNWFQLARHIVDHLYPESTSVDRHRQSALGQIEATSGILRISQEYQAAFGRTALDRLIADSVPDERFEPGELHELLLELPWSDVFTTNWDTLLERGTRRLLDRRYDVVRTIAEISRSMKPRIVKLHGSFPSNAPFILTEDDFRTYPRDFAPFVNMAQQSMMENVFCLLGFSGDDPNFLFWSGWVRDHLGKAAPMIYLVGWLELTAARRRLLEDRNVVPVDLSTLPGAAAWSDQSRDRKAIEWFLWNLKNGEPYPGISWPEPHPARRKKSVHGIEIPILSSAEPQEESFALPDPSPERPVRQVVQDEVRIWQHNRGLYPGWIVAPREIRERVWVFTERWIAPILSCLEEMALSDRLQTLDALNWRLELCLVPLSREIADPIDRILQEIDPSDRDLQALPDLGSTLQSSWLRLALTRFRFAREMDDAIAFELWVDRLRPLVTEFSWLDSELCYECCLYALSMLDHAAVEKILSSWQEPEEEPFWGIRKASLLAEVGRTSEAYRLSSESLARIQQRTRKDVVDIASLSREGWAMFLCQSFSFYEYELEGKARKESLEVSELDGSSKAFRKRWGRLAIHKCDPVDFEEFRERLDADVPQPLPTEREEKSFESVRRVVVFRSRDDLEDRLLPAHQFRRLMEEAGIPTTVGGVGLGRKPFLRVAAWLAGTAPQLAIGILLRACPGRREKSLDNIFTRSRIALMGEVECDNLVVKIEKSLDYSIAAAEKAQAAADLDRFHYWMSRVEVGAELLSRMVLRLPPDRAEAVLRRALQYVNSTLFQRRLELLDPLNHLLRWSLAAVGPKRVRGYAFEIVALPVPGAGGFEPEADFNLWPEPIGRISLSSLENVRPWESEEWGAAIERLIRATEKEGPYPRSRAISRLYVLARAGLLKDAERSKFAKALWEYRPLSRGRLPGDNSELYEWTVLRLPEPEPGIAEGAFRAAYLSPGDCTLEEQWINNVISAVNNGLALAPAEVDQIYERVVAWWQGGGAEKATKERTFWERGGEAIQWPVVRLLLTVLTSKIPLADSRIVTLLELVEDLRRLCFPIEPIYPSLIRLKPELQGEFLRRLRSSLASSEKRTAEVAIEAVWSWLHLGPSWGLEPPPVDLVREIGLAISVRRPSNLMKALKAAEWIFAERPAARTVEFDRFVVEGLEYLLGQTRYEAHGTAESVLGWPHVSELRAQCVRVAQAMQSAGLGGEEAVVEWLRVKENDPLAEVRFAQSEWVQEGME